MTSSIIEILFSEQWDDKHVVMALKNVVFTSPGEWITIEKYFLIIAGNIFKLSKDCLLMPLRALITTRNAVVLSEVVVSVSPGRRTTVEKYSLTFSGNNFKLSKTCLLMPLRALNTTLNAVVLSKVLLISYV